MNQVVVWDKIVQKPEPKRIKLTKQDTKYIFYDPYFSLR